jgi:prophage antirepressor-like protein
MKENKLQVFNNEELGEIRVLEKDGEPWFVGKDVAEKLGYKNPRSTISKKVDEEDRGVAKMETPSGTQDMTIINESGFYSLVLSSKLPLAKQLKHWVTAEVIPSIRKTGEYINPQKNNQQSEMNNYIVGLAKSIQYSNQAISGILVSMNNIQEFVKDSINAKDQQLDEARELMGIRDRNTKMLTQTLKDKLSELTGENIYATNPIYIRNKIKVFREFKVFSWESIPIGQFNAVYAYIDTLDEAM